MPRSIRLVALVVLLAACGAGESISPPPPAPPPAPPPPPPPPAPVVTTVEVSPPTASPLVGETVRLTATVKDQNGATMSGEAATWSSSAPAVATVAADGAATAVAAGQATITATVDGKTAGAALTVRPLGAPVTATIGAAGGAVQGTLNGGGSVSLTIPAAALGAPTALTIDTATAGAGIPAAFRMSPAGLVFAKPVTIRVVVGTAAALDPTTAIAFMIGTRKIVLETDVDQATGTLTAKAEVLGEATPPATGPRPTGGSGSGPVNVVVTAVGIQERLFDAAARIGLLETEGTLFAADQALLAMGALLDILPVPVSDPQSLSLVDRWRTAACGDYQFALNALRNWNFSTDFEGLRRVARDLAGWEQEALQLNDRLAASSLTGCTQISEPTFLEEYVDKVTLLLPRIEGEIAGLDLKTEFTTILRDRVGQLMNVASDLFLAGDVTVHQDIETILTQVLGRLRVAGFEACRIDRSQDIQSALAMAEAGAGTVATVSPYDVGDIYRDVTFCGADLLWKEIDGSQNQVTTRHGGTGAGLDQETRQTALKTSSGPTGKLELTGDIRPLLCPSHASQNNERLLVTAGSTTLADVTAPGNNQYFQANPLVITFAALRSAGGIAADAAGTVSIFVRRTGGLCGGLFGGLQHETLHRLDVELVTGAVTVAPQNVTLAPGAQQTFTATVTGFPNTAVTWTATGGSISSAGLYTAGNTGGTFTVTAKSVADPTKTATATVVISVPIVITISPPNTSVARGGQVSFSATVTGTTNTAVTWSAGGGSINSSGLYTAGNATGQFTVTARSVADPTKSASTTITIVTGGPPPPTPSFGVRNTNGLPPFSSPARFRAHAVNLAGAGLSVDEVRWTITATSPNDPFQNGILQSALGITTGGPNTIDQFTTEWTASVTFPTVWATGFFLHPVITAQACAFKNGVIVRNFQQLPLCSSDVLRMP